MDGASEQLFAGSGLTLDQDRNRPQRNPPGAGDDALHNLTLADDGVEIGGARQADLVRNDPRLGLGPQPVS
jgi:hypothetical protein